MMPVTLLYTQVMGEYIPKSEYFEHPEKIVEFAESIGAFRLKAKDLENGGWFSYVDEKGNPTLDDSNEWEIQTAKCMNTQSRVAYLYTRLFMMTGKEKYLEHARYALKFLYEEGWRDGWVFLIDSDGVIVPDHWGTADYWSFMQHYALLGPSVMTEATGGEIDWGDGAPTDKDMLFKGVDFLYNEFWDPNPAHSGYYDHVSYDMSNRFGKGFTSNVDAITTHAHLMAAMYGGEHSTRLNEIGQVLVDHLVGHMDGAAIGFPEYYDTNWNNLDTLRSDIGHHVKTSWVLARAYLMDTTQTHFKDAAKKILWDIWDNGGYDITNGGVFSHANWKSGEITHTTKTHWMLEQGYTAGIINYHIADTQKDKDMYLEMADGNLSFFMDHQLDLVDGEGWDIMSEDGSEIETKSKGGLFNSGYHTVEWCYYVYMYGGLYYTQAPMSLYYKFLPKDSEWSIKLSPIAIQDDQLKITAVTIDGEAYDEFDMDSRTITFKEGVGGIVKVTYQVAASIGDSHLGTESSSENSSSIVNDISSSSEVVSSMDEYSSTESSLGDVESSHEEALSEAVITDLFAEGENSRDIVLHNLHDGTVVHSLNPDLNYSFFSVQGELLATAMPHTDGSLRIPNSILSGVVVIKQMR